LIESQLTEVAAGVFELGLPIPFEEGRVNVFLLPEGAAVDMIDCGMSSEESLELVRQAVREVGGAGARLRRLVVTHIHPDHYGAAGALVGGGADLYLHRLEVPMVHPRYLELEQLVIEVGLYLEVNGVPEAEAEEMRNASRVLRDFVNPAAPAVQLDGAETIELGRRRLRVEWTPGHSPGHVCLFDPDASLLFSGDDLLPDTSPNIGLHPQSTPNPLDDYLAGLQRLARLGPALVLPAHGRPFTDAAAVVHAMTAHHQRRKAQVVEILGERELSGWEVALELWGERRHPHDKRLALQEALAHLQSLAVEGSVEKLAGSGAVTWQARPAPSGPPESVSGRRRR
jgi:glyoxylase-like metal-dependent hydrolase (beta-lactamase superfamily II)